MKKFIFIISVVLLTLGIHGTSSTDKNNDVSKVSYTTIKHFKKEFPGAKKVLWKKTDQCIKALFTFDGKKMGALYDSQSNFLGAVEYVAYSEIPEKARTEMEKKFKDYTFTSALKIVGRPSTSDSDDVGTYWVDMSNNVKQLYINISPSLDVALYKTVKLETIASN